jgi:hypothetical protein
MQSNERVQPGVSLEVETQRGLNSLQNEWLTGCPEIEWGSTVEGCGSGMKFKLGHYQIYCRIRKSN